MCKSAAQVRPKVHAEKYSRRENNNMNLGLVNDLSEKMGDGLDTQIIETYIVSCASSCCSSGSKNAIPENSNVSRDLS